MVVNVKIIHFKIALAIAFQRVTFARLDPPLSGREKEEGLARQTIDMKTIH